jgi:hypothetical protein
MKTFRLGADHLQRNQAVQLAIAHFVDCAHTAFPELLENFVAACQHRAGNYGDVRIGIRARLVGNLRPNGRNLPNFFLLRPGRTRDEVLYRLENGSVTEVNGRAAVATTCRAGGIRQLTLGTDHNCVFGKYLFNLSVFGPKTQGLQVSSSRHTILHKKAQVEIYWLFSYLVAC